MTFDFKPAKREATPCLVGIVGPSGSGKTLSALRLATGMRKVSGGDIAVIDTEGRRALHYADRIKFLHLDFGPPFGSMRYLGAVEAAVTKGCKTIVIDSISHEHEGEGGLLEQAGLGPDKSGNIPYSAWIKPKAARRRMINRFLQLSCNLIFCFRAQEKSKFAPGKEPESRGFQPIGAEAFMYEMLISFLLLPGSKGSPVWTTEHDKSQRSLMKCPGHFAPLFPCPGVQLDEKIGLALAQWSAGGDPPTPVEKPDQPAPAKP